jgi:peptide/nickel transport system substrate-binding protein
MKKFNKMALLGAIMISSLFLGMSNPVAAYDADVFLYGVPGTSIMRDVDHHEAWDSSSIDVMYQVLEGLVAYDLADPDLPIVPKLATDLGTWNTENTEITFNLRTGVKFHDGTDFDADAVKWNFDRLMAYTIGNGTAEAVNNSVCQVAELYAPLNGQVVINETQVISPSSVKFVLNYAYSPFLPLLCFTASWIAAVDSMPYVQTFSPLSTGTIGSYGDGDQMIGTGPFVYDADNVYNPDELDFIAFDQYWGEQPSIQKMIWVRYANTEAVDQALLNGDIHFPAASLPEFYDQFDESPTVELQESRRGTGITYMGMHVPNVDATFREVISFAVDYDYIIEELLLGYAARLKSPVPLGIKDAIEPADVGVLNLTRAREVLFASPYLDETNDLNMSDDFDDFDWIALSESNPVATFNYTYNIGSSLRYDMGTIIQENLKRVGIRLELRGVTWSDFLNKLYGDWHQLELYLVGWGPDYNDPSNFINPLFSNTSGSNSAQVNDHEVQTKMMEALAVTDEAARTVLYTEIQTRIVEVIRPWCFISVSLGRAAWDYRVSNFPRNAMGNIYFYPVTWEPNKELPEDGGFIPGYSFVALIGIAAFSLLAISKKIRK